ncbi:hypothetical protein BaRGS_00032891 [Batillaria attramentaria]|uniref:Uncharacterized protein n=1 Tax=Batillaria attramentaria TaxID=370345 RepID=A0ABD0JM07_9CAEN
MCTATCEPRLPARPCSSWTFQSRSKTCGKGLQVRCRLTDACGTNSAEAKMLAGASPRPMSRERERRTSTRLHRGIPTGSEMQREMTRMSATPMQQGQMVGQINSGLRRGSASKEDNARSGSSKHVRK